MKVISGGQTGADQAGLDSATECGIQTGGYAPSNYMTKNGPNLKLRTFGLITVDGGYKKRTRLNVKNSDCTLRFAYNFNSPGEKCTLNAIHDYQKTYKDIDLNYPITEKIIQELAEWITKNKFNIVNIAGNTQTKKLDTYTPTFEALYKLWMRIKN